MDRADESSKSDDSHTAGKEGQSTSPSEEASLTQSVTSDRCPSGQRVDMIAASEPATNTQPKRNDHTGVPSASHPLLEGSTQDVIDDIFGSAEPFKSVRQPSVGHTV